MVGTTLPTPMYALYADRMHFAVLTTTVDLRHLRRRRARRAAGVRALVRRDRQAARCCWPGAASRWPAPWCSCSPTTCRCCWSAGCCRDCRRASSPAPPPPPSSRPRRRDRRDRAAAVATVANIGGLGIGPLLAGRAGQYAPDPLQLRFVVHIVLVVLAVGAVLLAPETSSRTGRIGAATAVGARRDAAGVPDRGDRGVRRFRRDGPVHRGGAVVRRRSSSASTTTPSPALVGAARSSSPRRSPSCRRAASRRARAVAVGCAILVVGMVILAVALHFSSLAGLIVAAVVAGIGQGISFSRGLAAVAERHPPTAARRSARRTSSSPTWRSRCR